MARLPFTPSHSSLDKFENCPRAYQAQYVTKEVQWKDSAPSCLGTCLHKLAEWYIDMKVRDDCPVMDDIFHVQLSEGTFKAVLLETRVSIPPTYDELRKHWSNILDVLNKMPFVEGAYIDTEVKLCVNNDFVSAAYMSKDGFFRAIVDVLIKIGDQAILIDWKTGKDLKETKQLQRSAMTVLLCFPQVNKATVVYVSSRGHAPITRAYTRDNIMDLINEVKATAGRLVESYDANVWPPIKSGLCKMWCDVSQCKHNGRTKAQVDAGYRG